MSEPTINDYILGRADYKGWRCRGYAARVLVFGKDGQTVSAEGDMQTALDDVKLRIDELESAPH